MAKKTVTNRPKKITSKNPQLLNLLKAGAYITFRDGYQFLGDPRNQYIVCNTPLGLHDKQFHLTSEGLKAAFDCKRKYFKSLN